MSKISEKIIVIDPKTYKEMQQNSSNKQVIGRRIRNAKYKRMSVKFNLMQYLLLKCTKIKNQPRKKRWAKLPPLYTTRRRGKQREYKRIKLSKLKRTILQYRQLKQQEQQQNYLSLKDYVKEVKCDENSVELGPLAKNEDTIASNNLEEDEDTIASNNLEEDDKIKICLQIQLLKIDTNDDATELAHSSQNLNLNTSETIQSKTKFERNGEKSTLKNYDGTVEKMVQRRQITHSGRFREYCDNCSTSHLIELSEQLLRDSYRFQKRAYESNQIKAAAHKRFVIGFHEVQSLLKVKKIKLIIIATDCEKCESKGGLDEIISNIKVTCKDQQVPLAFVFKRRQLAYILWKKASISCVGLLNYDGLHDTFNKFTIALQDAREMYLKLRNAEKN